MKDFFFINYSSLLVTANLPVIEGVDVFLLSVCNYNRLGQSKSKNNFIYNTVQIVSKKHSLTLVALLLASFALAIALELAM